jgi:hypothetical protein
MISIRKFTFCLAWIGHRVRSFQIRWVQVALDRISSSICMERSLVYCFEWIELLSFEVEVQSAFKKVLRLPSLSAKAIFCES